MRSMLQMVLLMLAAVSGVVPVPARAQDDQLRVFLADHCVSQPRESWQVIVWILGGIGSSILKGIGEDLWALAKEELRPQFYDGEAAADGVFYVTDGGKVRLSFTCIIVARGVFGGEGEGAVIPGWVSPNREVVASAIKLREKPSFYAEFFPVLSAEQPENGAMRLEPGVVMFERAASLEKTSDGAYDIQLAIEIRQPLGSGVAPSATGFRTFLWSNLKPGTTFQPETSATGWYQFPPTAADSQGPFTVVVNLREGGDLKPLFSRVSDRVRESLGGG